jgi:hypothetical protein
VASLISFLAPQKGSAQLWQGATTLAPGAVSLGAFGSFIFAPSSNFLGTLQLKVGVVRFMDFELKGGWGSVPWFTSFHTKFSVINSDFIDWGVRVGYRYQSSHALEVSLPISHEWDKLEIYVSPEFLAVFSVGNSPQYGFGIIPGVDFRFGKRVKLYLEFLMGTLPFYSQGSAGLRLFF